MQHVPEPHYSFTIPSIHDDTTLDCRIYHPDILSRPRSARSEGQTQWRKRGIVIAHPYAPMGGTYDDRIVSLVVEEFLSMDHVVGTFNFRGAHGSKGRTSWSGKPEVDDYISFAACFIHYLSYLHPFPPPDSSFTPDQPPRPPQIPEAREPAPIHNRDTPLVILGGYSYGSLILRNLPPVPSILHPFSAPINGSAAAEVVLRAYKLSDQSNLEWINLAHDHERRKRNVHGHEQKLSITMGGEETSPNQRRSSREIRRSMDGGGRNFDFGEKLRSLSHKRVKETKVLLETDTPRATIGMPDIRYLLISPLTAPISALAAPGLAHKFWSKEKDHREIIGKYASLAISGDEDIFASARKTQQWAEKLGKEAGSRFTHVEIAGAGHFWIEQTVEIKLRAALKDWGEEIQDD